MLESTRVAPDGDEGLPVDHVEQARLRVRSDPFRVNLVAVRRTRDVGPVERDEAVAVEPVARDDVEVVVGDVEMAVGFRIGDAGRLRVHELVGSDELTSARGNLEDVCLHPAVHLADLCDFRVRDEHRAARGMVGDPCWIGARDFAQRAALNSGGNVACLKQLSRRVTELRLTCERLRAGQRLCGGVLGHGKRRYQCGDEKCGGACLLAHGSSFLEEGCCAGLIGNQQVQCPCPHRVSRSRTERGAAASLDVTRWPSRHGLRAVAST